MAESAQEDIVIVDDMTIREVKDAEKQLGLSVQEVITKWEGKFKGLKVKNIGMGKDNKIIAITHII